MIDREKVISEFEDFVKSFSKRDDTYYKGLFVSVLALLKEQEAVVPLTIDDAVSEIMDKHYKRLKEQEAVEPKWTSIKERYPDKEGFYLVSADHGNYHPWIAEMRIYKGIKGFCNGAVMPCVGAWMPLPDPYKEGR